MREESYRAWLKHRGLAESSVGTYVIDGKRVEKYYTDLDALYDEDRLAGLLEELRYSAEDRRNNAPNPSKIPIKGNPYHSLGGYRSTVTRYCEYRDADESAVVHVDGAEPERQERVFGLERDLQAAMRDAIEELEPGLCIIDDGVERSVNSGFIDITARAPDGTVVVIELKAGAAKREAVGQILSYMGDVAADEGGEVRGILVAGDFDSRTRAAARMVPSLALRRYSVTFAFHDVEDAG